jgi:hypothetical protein
VPSPPSAIGHIIISAAGSERLMPRAIAAATSAALRLPLYLSGAITIRIRICYTIGVDLLRLAGVQPAALSARSTASRGLDALMMPPASPR